MDDNVIVQSVADLQAEAMLKAAIADIGDSLESLYPGWGWMIQLMPAGDGSTQALTVVSARLNPSYTLFLTERSMKGGKWPKKTIMRMAGELLERFGMPRVSFRKAVDRYVERKVQCNHPKGWLIPDLQDKDATKLMVRERREQAMVKH